MLVFQERLCFDEWDAIYIYIYIVMIDIVFFIWCVLFEDLVVWILGMKEIYMCRMRFVVNVAIEDFNWYVVILIIMMILIWDGVVNKDHVNMNWCYCWWLCEYEMRLLLFNFERLDILCASVGHPCEKLWPFKSLPSASPKFGINLPWL